MNILIWIFLALTGGVLTHFIEEYLSEKDFGQMIFFAIFGALAIILFTTPNLNFTTIQLFSFAGIGTLVLFLLGKNISSKYY